MPLWIPLTIAAAFLQNLRSVLQKRLKSRMGTTGATFARFGFGFPVALLYAVLLHAAGGLPWPEANPTFLLAVAVGGLAQIAGTFLLVSLFSVRNFVVGTAYSKTEPIQAALFGVLILGEGVPADTVLAILLGLAGVLLMSLSGRAPGAEGAMRVFLSRAAAVGLLSGAGFALSAVGVRWAALSLEGGVAMRAAYTLVCVTGFQTLAMLLWMALREPGEIRAVGRAWAPSLVVGLVGVVGSAGWFTAMTLESVAYVRALGQIELVFTFAASVLVFHERVAKTEAAGCVLIVGAILVLLGQTAG